MMGYFECAKIPVVCQIADLIERGVVKDKTYLQVAFDILQVEFRQWEQHKYDP